MKKNIMYTLSATAIALFVSSAANAQSIATEAGRVSDLYRNGIQTQMDREVDLRDSEAAVGAYLDQNLISGKGNILSLGVEGAYKLTDSFAVGGSIQAPLNSDLPNNYSTTGSESPSVGLYTKYQANDDGTGVNAKVSAAYGEQKMNVYDLDLHGQTRLYGYGVQAQVGYGLDHYGLLVTPYMGVSYTNLKQNSYAAQNVDVNKFSEERTSMKFGVKADYRINHTFKVDADAGLHANISTNRHGFMAKDGSDVYQFNSDDNKVQPYMQVGVVADLDPQSSIRLSGGASKQAYDNTVGVVDLGYQYRF